MPRLTEKDIQTREVLDWQGLHLLHFAGSACSQKVRIFLNLKGIDWTAHAVNLATQKNYEPWFLGINPRGLVPVLVHDGAVYIESNDILAYLEEVFPEPRLIEEGQGEEVSALLREEDDLHLSLRSLTMRFVVPRFLAAKRPASLAAYEEDRGTVGGLPDDHKEVELRFWRDFARQGVTDAETLEAASRFRKVYQRFEAILGDRAYLLGDSLGLLDIAWFIYTHRLMRAGYPFAQQHPHVYRWYRDLFSRDAFSKEVSEALPIRLVSAGLRAAHQLRGRTLAEVAASAWDPGTLRS